MSLSTSEKTPYDTKIKFYVSTNYVGCENSEILSIEEIGFDREDWDEMSAEEQDNRLQEYHEEWVWQNIEASYYPVEDYED